MQRWRSYVRIAIAVALASSLGLFTSNFALERTHPFWTVAWIVELTGVSIACCLWFAAREIWSGRKHTDLSDCAYALLASSVVWLPILAAGVFYLGSLFLGEGSPVPAWFKEAVFWVVAAAIPAVHFTAFVQIVQTSRASRVVFAPLYGLMFLIEVLLFGVATNLLQLGLH